MQHPRKRNTTSRPHRLPLDAPGTGARAPSTAFGTKQQPFNSPTSALSLSSATRAFRLFQPAPRVGKPGGQRVGERVGDAFYPTWRTGSKFRRLAQNKAYYAVLAVQVSFHFAWHSSISAAPKNLVFGNFAEFRRIVGPLADSGRGGRVALCTEPQWGRSAAS